MRLKYQYVAFALLVCLFVCGVAPLVMRGSFVFSAEKARSQERMQWLKGASTSWDEETESQALELEAEMLLHYPERQSPDSTQQARPL